MKKFLTVLFGLLFLQNSFCDNFIAEAPDIGSDMMDYLDDKMDEAAIRELCSKLLVYADMHNFNIVLEYGDNKLFNPSSSDCKAYQMNVVKWILQETAMQLMKANFEEHSQCTQDLMERSAMLHCEGFQSSVIRDLERQGFEFDFSGNGTVIDCSKTDNRCVVNRPFTNGTATGFYTACCSIPVYSCDQEKTDSSSFYSAHMGYVGFHDYDIVNTALTLKDFDYGCKRIK